jgi:hypothetical protein
MKTGNREIDAIFDRIKARDEDDNRMFVAVAKAILEAPIGEAGKAAVLKPVAKVFLNFRRRVTLERELKRAARALGESLSGENFACLQDVRRQLAALE